MVESTQYGTFEEWEFLKSLGAHRTTNKDVTTIASPEERLQLLKNYKKSMESREEWGSINPAIVIGIVDKFIAQLAVETGVPVC